MSGTQSGPGSRASFEEHRRTPRIDVRHRLSGYLVALDRPVVVRDISLGGFSVESDQALPAGTHQVRLSEGDRWSVTVTAASRHHRTQPSPGGPRHVMGFEFQDQSPATQHTLRLLCERLVADQPES